MSRLFGEKISYQDALNHFVTAFILIPAMLVGGYLMYMNFKAAEELAQLIVKDSTEVVGKDISVSFASLRGELENALSNQTLAEFSQDAGLEEIAIQRLASMVENSAAITSTFIRDNNGATLAAYPGPDTAQESVVVDRATRKIVNENSATNRAEFYMLDGSPVEGQDASDEAGLDKQFFFAIPLRTYRQSTDTPYQVRSVLWVQIDMQHFLANAPRPEWAASSRYSFSVSDQLVLESKSIGMGSEDRVAAETNLSIDVIYSSAKQAIRFGLSESTSVFTRDARDFLMQGVLALLAIGALLAFFMKTFSATLNRPLHLLISYSQHISHGDYEEAPKELVFDEFEQLRLAMSTMADKVQKSMEQLEHFASTDALTGLMNRRSFDDSGEREFERASRSADAQKTLWLIILDIDHFKRVNDTAGHAVGDVVIQAVASELATISRKSDIVGRLGGEEYGILLPEATREGVARVANEILQKIPQLVIDGWTASGGPVTVSIGCASFDGKANFDELYRIADESLYASKWNGRDCVSFESDVAANDTDGESIANEKAAS